MSDLNRDRVQQYLHSLFRAPVSLRAMSVLGEAHELSDVKDYGYGIPVRVDFQVNGESRTAVIHTMPPAPFGHEHMADRAQELLWEHQAFNKLSRHVRSLDVCGFGPKGELISVGGVNEFGLITEYVEGQGYSHDLERIRESGSLTQLDTARANALCDYLIEIHAACGSEPSLYVRRIRELVGHGECIMGLVDSYPQHPQVPQDLLREIEHLCVNWRWRLKHRTHRLRQVHGDFHPWNILFRSGTDFSVLDRSRGEFGDAADDVTSLTLNYVFFSLQRSGRLEGAFQELFHDFWARYLEGTRDNEIFRVAAPFFAFRGLVMASPLWYPSLTDSVRRTLLTFVLSVLKSAEFDPQKVNEYCGH